MTDTKISTGPNARPRETTIAQTGEGLPDDTSTPIAVDEREVERVRQKLTEGTSMESQTDLENQIATDNDRAQKGSA